MVGAGASRGGWGLGGGLAVRARVGWFGEGWPGDSERAGAGVAGGSCAGGRRAGERQVRVEGVACGRKEGGGGGRGGGPGWEVWGTSSRGGVTVAAHVGSLGWGELVASQ